MERPARPLILQHLHSVYLIGIYYPLPEPVTTKILNSVLRFLSKQNAADYLIKNKMVGNPIISMIKDICLITKQSGKPSSNPDYKVQD